MIGVFKPLSVSVHWITERFSMRIPTLPSLLVLLLSSACRTTEKLDEEEVLDTGGVAQTPDADGDGYNEDEDCDDNNSLVNPGATEICDGIDNNCDGQSDEGVTSTFYADSDGDGFGDEASVTESCEQPDGYVPIGNDCDDDNDEVYPSAPERCDGIDNDCDGEIDEELTEYWYADGDGDGYGDPETGTESCDPKQGYVDNSEDCDDTNDEAFPDNPEVCDEADNDCDGDVDEGVTTTYYEDVDADDYGVSDTTTESCDRPTGYADAPGDCNDDDEDINPDAEEVCDDIDNDCDGSIDEGAANPDTFYADTDGDGFGDIDSRQESCDTLSGYVLNALDCDDSTSDISPDVAEECGDELAEGAPGTSKGQ